MDTELVSLRSAKIENESKIDYQTERIRSLVSENECYIRNISNLEQKLVTAHEAIEVRNL